MTSAPQCDRGAGKCRQLPAQPGCVQRNSQTWTLEDWEFLRLHYPNSLPALTRLLWKPHHPSPLQEDVDRNLPHQADAAGPSLGVERRCEEEERSELPVLLFFLSFSTLEQ